MAVRRPALRVVWRYRSSVRVVELHQLMVNAELLSETIGFISKLIPFIFIPFPSLSLKWNKKLNFWLKIFSMCIISEIELLLSFSRHSFPLTCLLHILSFGVQWVHTASPNVMLCSLEIIFMWFWSLYFEWWNLFNRKYFRIWNDVMDAECPFRRKKALVNWCSLFKKHSGFETNSHVASVLS